MELIVRPDLVGPCPLSEPEDEASSSPGPEKGEPSVLGPGASQGRGALKSLARRQAPCSRDSSEIRPKERRACSPW
jgi:hypothetical protein